MDVDPKKEEKKAVLKDIFFDQLKLAFTDLVKGVVNAKYLGLFIATWVILSVMASVIRRAEDKCHIHYPLESFLAINLICPTSVTEKILTK